MTSTLEMLEKLATTPVWAGNSPDRQDHMQGSGMSSDVHRSVKRETESLRRSLAVREEDFRCVIIAPD